MILALFTARSRYKDYGDNAMFLAREHISVAASSFKPPVAVGRVGGGAGVAVGAIAVAITPPIASAIASAIAVTIASAIASAIAPTTAAARVVTIPPVVKPLAGNRDIDLHVCVRVIRDGYGLLLPILRIEVQNGRIHRQWAVCIRFAWSSHRILVERNTHSSN
jgi:hypothetical protein